MNDELLKDLCCPESRQSLSPADDDLVRRLNDEVKNGTLKNRSGQKIEDAFDGGLIREDGKALYPVRQGIPVLLVAEAISVGD